jgi:hypothetical protein
MLATGGEFGTERSRFRPLLRAFFGLTLVERVLRAGDGATTGVASRSGGSPSETSIISADCSSLTGVVGASAGGVVGASAGGVVGASAGGVVIAGAAIVGVEISASAG